jgi:hypothetical protein
MTRRQQATRGTQIMMLTAVMDGAGEEAIAAGHDDLPPAPTVSVTTGLKGAPLAAGRRNMS